MSNQRPLSAMGGAAGLAGGAREKTYFEMQREALIGEIAMVGNEFSSVEALWSQFENVMAKEPEEEGNKTDAGAEGEGDDTPKKED
ncbi:hypothetical protein G7054_g9225 [Neopestalotiopsis clavispora]|nr:hypothetical protein G7054_g9225 [Neopestalotiopsis clavispora]